MIGYPVAAAMEIARESIDMFLNGRLVEAEDLFRHHQDNRQVCMAQCYCSVMVRTEEFSAVLWMVGCLFILYLFYIYIGLQSVVPEIQT